MIYIIITTSIRNKIGVQNAVHREKRYRESITQLLQIVKNDPTIKVVIVENNGYRETFLREFDCDICYTENNKFLFNHKGGNELLDMKQVIQHYNIRDDDMILKLTGRYKLLNANFIEVVKRNPDYDAFVKFFNVCTKKYIFNDCVLGLFAVKCKYVKDFQYQFVQSAECDFAVYIRKNVEETKIMEMKQLHLECCFADDLRILVV